MEADSNNRKFTQDNSDIEDTVSTEQNTQIGTLQTNNEVSSSWSTPNAYNSYQEIRQQVEHFEHLADEDQVVAITLPDYPFFTETRLQSLIVHQSGTVLIHGEAKGGKSVSVRDNIQSLSYALSLMSRPPRSTRQTIEVGFIAVA